MMERGEDPEVQRSCRDLLIYPRRLIYGVFNVLMRLELVIVLLYKTFHYIQPFNSFELVRFLY